MTRKKVKISINSLVIMINEIVNDKLNKVTIYNDISGNSAESYIEFFKKELGIIIGRTNCKLVNLLNFLSIIKTYYYTSKLNGNGKNKDGQPYDYVIVHSVTIF